MIDIIDNFMNSWSTGNINLIEKVDLVEFVTSYYY